MEGRQLVAKRKVTAAAAAIGGHELYRREHKAAEEYVSKNHPGAVYRIGCYCCYGDGPDVDFVTVTDDDGGYTIETWINYDFNLEDHL